MLEGRGKRKGSAALPTMFRVAVVGVGHLGRHHARILSQMPGVDLVGVFDSNALRAEEVAAVTGSRVFSNVDSIAEEIDAVTVAVPTEFHAEVALPFLRAGISVLVEKPISKSVEEANSLIESASFSSATLAVGHTERYNPAVEMAQQLISEPRFIEVHRLAPFTPRSTDVDVIFDLMVHDIDVLLSIVTGEPVSVEAVGIPVLTDRVDIANVRLRFDTGCIVNLTASRISREKVRKFRVFQSESYISVDYSAQDVEAWRVKLGRSGEPIIVGGKVEVKRAEPLEKEIADFVRASKTGSRPRVDGEDGRRALLLAEQIASAIDSP